METPQFEVARWLGVLLAALTTVVGTLVHPRVFGTLAGALAGPALFGIATALTLRAFPDLESFLEAPTGLWLAVLLVVTGLVSCSLIAIAFWFRLQYQLTWTEPEQAEVSTFAKVCPPSIVTACAACTAGVMLAITVAGVALVPVLNLGD